MEERHYFPVLREHFFRLRPGDVVELEAWNKHDDVTVEVNRRKRGDFLGETPDGDTVVIIPSYYGGKYGHVGDGNPWLRTGDGESIGEIKSMTVISLSD